jgi:hypothetical protein
VISCCASIAVPSIARAAALVHQRRTVSRVRLLDRAPRLVMGAIRESVGGAPPSRANMRRTGRNRNCLRPLQQFNP